jgi:hypothetical protein
MFKSPINHHVVFKIERVDELNPQLYKIMNQNIYLKFTLINCGFNFRKINKLIDFIALFKETLQFSMR